MKIDRQKVFDKYNGKCAYCSCDLQKGWHIDHIQPVIRDLKTGKFEKPQNHTIENINPACASCNTQKSSYTLEQFRHNIQHFVNSLNIYSTQYKFAKRYGLVQETDIKVEFYFEKINNTTP